MKTQRILDSFETFLKIALLGILALSAVMFLFVFSINWEDWFFGIKLDGLAAGLYLLIKGLAAAGLGILLLLYDRYATITAGFATIYYGYLFVDSTFTVQRLTTGFLSAFLLVLFLISVIFLLIRIIKARFGNGIDRVG